MSDYRRVYPELAGYRVRGQEAPPPSFPEACPTCGAAGVTRNESRLAEIVYACGGTYTKKPQIQNHTDLYWGRCGQEESI